MSFLVLLVLTLTCLEGKWPAPPDWLDLPGSILTTWLGVAGLTGLAAWLTRYFSPRFYRDPDARPILLRSGARYRRWHLLGMVGFYVLALYVLGWGWTAKNLLTFATWTMPGVELFILSPFLAALVLSWTFAYDLERAVHETGSHDDETFPRRWAYVALQARHNLILALPPLVLLLVQETLLELLPLREDNRLLPVVAVLLLVGIFVGIPWLLRLFLGLKPLPPGPLRDRLLATARRLDFRCNDILLWNTRNTVTNAMVTGPLPYLRYVVLTDRLIRDMTPEEVEAVFGHEVGHIKHHHMLFYFGFLMASLLVLAGACEATSHCLDKESVQTFLETSLPQVKDLLDTYEVLAALPLLFLLGTYIFVVFGFLSRRCERQADIYGCRTVSCPVFIEALEKVARLNGISRDRPGWLSSWQHATIASRVDFLRQMSADPAVEPRFQRRVFLVKWGMVLGLSAGLSVVVLALGGVGGLWDVLKVQERGQAVQKNGLAKN